MNPSLHNTVVDGLLLQSYCFCHVEFLRPELTSILLTSDFFLFPTKTSPAYPEERRWYWGKLCRQIGKPCCQTDLEKCLWRFSTWCFTHRLVPAWVSLEHSQLLYQQHRPNRPQPGGNVFWWLVPSASWGHSALLNSLSTWGLDVENDPGQTLKLASLLLISSHGTAKGSTFSDCLP